MDWLSSEDKEQIKNAVALAEEHTNAEIRVFVEQQCSDSPLDRAKFLFHKLDMDKTKDRNGVLIYLAYESRKFALFGDQGIHEKVGQSFWNDTTADMQGLFRQGKFYEGILEGLKDCGEQLSKYFPKDEHDTNELPNDIIIG